MLKHKRTVFWFLYCVTLLFWGMLFQVFVGGHYEERASVLLTVVLSLVPSLALADHYASRSVGKGVFALAVYHILAAVILTLVLPRGGVSGMMWVVAAMYGAAIGSSLALVQRVGHEMSKRFTAFLIVIAMVVWAMVGICGAGYLCGL